MQKTELKEAVLYEKLGDGKVHCFLCSHHCRIAPGGRGFCGVRKNSDGSLFTEAYGWVVARHVDPIEKKPLFHVLPGTSAYSVAAIGCNFQCSFCQNWQISQASEARKLGLSADEMSPQEIVDAAVAARCRSIAYTYTEPTIFFEYAYETARRAKEKGLRNLFVTNGYMTEQALEMIQPYLDAANVDLKFFNDRAYRTICKGTLEPVLHTIRQMHQRHIWVEITTLVIPGENDSDEELRQIASFIAGVGKEIPWHISAFHPDYRLLDHEATPGDVLDRACAIGKEAGLQYVYKGNVMEEESTRCHNCNDILIERMVYNVLSNRLKGNRCPQCGAVLAGLFD